MVINKVSLPEPRINQSFLIDYMSFKRDELFVAVMTLFVLII